MVQDLNGHINACLTDAAKFYKCNKKDLLHKVDKNGYIHIRMKNEALKEKKK